jgi:hypothetical protein
LARSVACDVDKYLMVIIKNQNGFGDVLNLLGYPGLFDRATILEVLPVAALRLAKHFDLDPIKHRELAQVVNQLRKREKTGADFFGMPYEKIKVWVDLPLSDKRMKTMIEKKVMKTFRL